MQKNQIIDLQEHFERYCNVLPVFGFNRAKYDINLIKSYSLPILVNEQDIEPRVMKKANQFVSFKFGDIQLLDYMNFLGGATSLDSFLKAYKTKETKGFFPDEWFDCPEKMNNKELPPFDSFFSILRKSSPLEKDYNDFQKLVNSGLSTDEQWPSYELIEYFRLVLKITRICKTSGRIITCKISQISSSGITIKMLFWHWRQCRNWLNFTTTRELIC